jgi:hypothetical protein
MLVLVMIVQRRKERIEGDFRNTALDSSPRKNYTNVYENSGRTEGHL